MGGGPPCLAQNQGSSKSRFFNSSKSLLKNGIITHHKGSFGEEDRLNLLTGKNPEEGVFLGKLGRVRNGAWSQKRPDKISIKRGLRIA